MSHFYKQPPQVAPVVVVVVGFAILDLLIIISRLRLLSPYNNQPVASVCLAGQDYDHSPQLYVGGIQDLAGIKPDTNDL